MNERLTFGAGVRECRTTPRRNTSRSPASAVGVTLHQPAVRSYKASSGRAPRRSKAEARDWAWLGLVAFTAVLFLRPQDQFRALEVLHLAEVFAIVGLIGMITGRTARGLPPMPFTPEIGGLLAFGVAMLVGIPFSFWPGGSFKVFGDLYLKVFVIVVLMIDTLNRPERIDRFTSLIVLCSTFVATRSLFDYVRGIHLIEGGRLAGAVGGILGNPNDLALNLVVFLPFALAAAFKPGPAPRRVVAAICTAVMMVTVVLTKSRGGFLGLAAMLVMLVIGSVRVRPAIGVAAVVAVLAAVPLAPASFWERMVSIFDEERDTTGSRQARLDLMKEGVRVFAANPVLGVGLGQFVNYDPAGRKEAWNVTHNVILQVAAELGTVGLVPFIYLILRAAAAARIARKALSPPIRRGHSRGWRLGQREPVPDPERETLLTLITALGPALLGWIVCAQFASVALNWTFYFVLGILVTTRAAAVQYSTHGAPSLMRVS
jgi:putative inorganic carbon (hco3(-)) transporter